MSKLCPDCNGYQYMIAGITKTKCETCNGVGYVFDKPIEAIVDKLEGVAIAQENEDIKTVKKRGRPKRV